ncbi:hypothetical protein CC2G_002141 [Coprinopsis cinerea AmutBmut pab1-1]|nr:hypothetical protein CC2G_002141 [Coprinopsis cinerea AmutBmut pab1-1]
MTSTIGSTYNPDVQRYIVQASDVLSDHRLTVSPLADPSTVIWYTERYISYPASGPAEIVENIVHQPTNTICWTVHRPTNIRRQGWYVRLRSPLFPPGVSIPLQPVSSTSPYYVDGALSFKCQTNDVSRLPPPRPPPSLGSRGPGDRTSLSSMTSAGSSSSSSVHSYPPTPAASPPPLTRRDLPPIRVPPLNRGRSLTGEKEDVYIIGDDHDHDDLEESTTPTSAAAPTLPKTPTSAAHTPIANGFSDIKRPVSLSNGKGKEAPLQDVSMNQPNHPPGARPGRAPPPRALPPTRINEFILLPLSEAANASSGSFVNISTTPAPSPDSTQPSPTVYPHSHHRTHSNSYSRSNPPTTVSTNSSKPTGILGKAFNILKSTLPASVTNSLNSTMQGNSFTIVRVPDLAGVPGLNGSAGAQGGGAISPPPPYTSSTNLLAGPSSRGESSSGYPFQIPPAATTSAISSTSFVQPLPPPLLSFTDETSLFPVTFGLGGLFKGSGSSRSPPSLPAHSRASLQPPPRPLTHASTSSLPISSPTHLSASSGPSSSRSSSSSSSSHSRPPPNPNYTTLGTLTVSKSQLASLGVDTAFWITCALVFWGYLEEREGYLSAIDD